MADFPDLKYQEGYSFEFSPDVVRTKYSSLNTRQRLMFGNSDDIFSVKIQADNADLATFEAFVIDTLDNGADTYTGPYYTSDSESTGTLEVLNGKYSVSYLQPDLWDITYKLSVKDRDLSDEQNIYEMVNDQGGFSEYYDLIQATENAINFNNL